MLLVNIRLSTARGIGRTGGQVQVTYQTAHLRLSHKIDTGSRQGLSHIRDGKGSGSGSAKGLRLS